MLANYHAHTYRCHHASGTEEEYIKNAISYGIKEFGFSDHAPLDFGDGVESGYRVPVALTDDYIDTLRNLREKYKDKIKIHIGFEMEYYPDYFDQMLEFVKSKGAEYLILGQHFINNERDNLPHSCGEGHTAENLHNYTDRVITAMETGKFSYIAHPDVLNFNGDKEIYRKEAERLCKASLKYDIPLEINFLGLATNRNYPNPEFFKVAGEVGCKVIYGIDAHSADWSYFEDTVKKAEKMVNDFNLNLIDRVDLKKL